MISEQSEAIRYDIYLALGQVMVKATDLKTGEVCYAMGQDTDELKRKATERLERLNKYKTVHPGMMQ